MQMSPRNSTLYQFHIKIYFESFVSIYHWSTFCNLNIILNYWFISKTVNIRGNFIWKCPLGPWYPFSLTWFFLVMTTFEVTYCIFVYSNASIALISWYPFPFCAAIILGNIIIKWVNREAMNNSHHDKIIISANVVILLANFIYSFDLTWSSLFVTITLFKCFLHSLLK